MDIRTLGKTNYNVVSVGFGGILIQRLNENEAANLTERYYTMYGLKEWATERYAALSQKASACIKCGNCETKCPYDLPIREMPEDVAKKLG